MAILSLLFLPVGCNRVTIPEDTGKIIYELPEVPGADEPYPMPELYSEEDAVSETPAKPTE